LIQSCSDFRDSRLKSQGNELVRQIGQFKVREGRLPKSLSELGTRESLEGPLFYQKVGDERYVIWLRRELGEYVHMIPKQSNGSHKLGESFGRQISEK
jgi:hypothetical protein